MSSLNKIICFFSTKYYNNLKYNNRMLSATRIFFERTTKFTQTVSSLGNVYRNSKWSDLNIQNIKLGGVQQFFTILSTLIVTTCLLFLLLRGYKNSFSDILFLLTNVLYILQDSIYYIFLLIISIFYSLAFKLNSFLAKVLPLFFTPNYTTRVSNLTNVSYPTKINTKSNFKFSADLKSSNDILLAALFLQRTLNLLPKLDYALPTYNLRNHNGGLLRSHHNSNGGNVHVLLHANSTKNFLIRNTKPAVSVFKLEGSLSHFYLSNTFSKITTTKLNYEMLFSLSFADFKIISSNIKNNLFLGKQSKWFWKSTLLTDKSSLGLLSITNLKKLYGSSQYNNNFMTYNTWGSNRLSSQKNFFKTSSFLRNFSTDLGFTENKVLTTNNLVALNFYETSISWLIKKFSFLNSNQTNQTYIDFYYPVVKDYETFITEASTQKDFNVSNFFFFNNYYFQKGLVLNVNFRELSSFNQHHVGRNLSNSTSELFSTSDIEFVRYISTTTLSSRSGALYYSNIN